MNFKVEEVKEMKVASDELVAKLKEVLPMDDYAESNNIEGFEFEHNDVSFCLIEKGEDDWDDEGKYQYNTYYYQLVSYDKTLGRIWEVNDIDEYNIMVALPVSRSGSYFSDYYYSLGVPIVGRVSIETIPEVIIPEHEEVVCNNI